MDHPKDSKPTLNTGRRRDPQCPVEAGGQCRRFVRSLLLCSPAEDLPRLSLINRLILADARREGVWLDRAEIRAVIELSDRYNKLTEAT